MFSKYWPVNREVCVNQGQYPVRPSKQRERQEGLWYEAELPTAPGDPFYKRFNEVLDKAGFDRFCESNCAEFYHAKLRRPSLPPGLYFRVMMIGFFEGLLDSERGIA